MTSVYSDPLHSVITPDDTVPTKSSPYATITAEMTTPATNSTTQKSTATSLTGLQTTLTQEKEDANFWRKIKNDELWRTVFEDDAESSKIYASLTRQPTQVAKPTAPDFIQTTLNNTRYSNHGAPIMAAPPRNTSIQNHHLLESALYASGPGCLQLTRNQQSHHSANLNPHPRIEIYNSQQNQSLQTGRSSSQLYHEPHNSNQQYQLPKPYYPQQEIFVFKNIQYGPLLAAPPQYPKFIAYQNPYNPAELPRSSYAGNHLSLTHLPHSHLSPPAVFVDPTKSLPQLMAPLGYSLQSKPLSPILFVNPIALQTPTQQYAMKHLESRRTTLPLPETIFATPAMEPPIPQHMTEHSAPKSGHPLCSTLLSSFFSSFFSSVVSSVVSSFVSCVLGTRFSKSTNPDQKGVEGEKEETASTKPISERLPPILIKPSTAPSLQGRITDQLLPKDRSVAPAA